MKNFLKLMLFGSLICFYSLPLSVHLQPLNPAERIHKSNGSIDKQLTSSINKITVNIVKNCYGDHGTIIVNSPTDNSITPLFWDLHLVDIMVLNDISSISVTTDNLKKPKLFLIMVNSDVINLLLMLKSSAWWNIMSPFFLLDGSNSHCDNARANLKTAWKMNIVTTYFVCIDRHQRIPIIYTYNPYTNRAPHSWNEIKSTVNQSDHWTMYNQRYHEGIQCDDLHFDRTKLLDGSKINIIATFLNKKYIQNNKEYNESILDNEIMFDHDNTFIKTMIQELNVGIVINFVDDTFSVNTSHGPFKRLQDGSSDIAIVARPLVFTYKFNIVYSIFYSNCNILTQRRGYYTPFERIQNYYGIVTLVSMLIMLTMTFTVVLMSEQRRRYAFAAFEALRLLVNTGLHSRMNTCALRIFFSMMFLYFLIIHATFQGRISSFLTKPEERKNVEALEDLKDPRYTTIYAALGTNQLIDDPIIKQKVVIPDNQMCVNEVRENHSVACITDDGILQYTRMKNEIDELHIMKQPFGSSNWFYSVRDDWPLLNRINIVSMIGKHSGITLRHFQIMFKKMVDHNQQTFEKSDVHHRPISLTMLTFVFNIWGFGIICSIICFIFEILINRKRSGQVVQKRSKKIAPSTSRHTWTFKARPLPGDDIHRLVQIKTTIPAIVEYENSPLPAIE